MLVFFGFSNVFFFSDQIHSWHRADQYNKKCCLNFKNNKKKSLKKLLI
jgi:hypothetical protein